MAFEVEITEPALADAEAYFSFIRDVGKQPEAAERWFRGLVEAIYSLETFPERCVLIPEQDQFLVEIRHLLYFSHRIVFGIQLDRQLVTVYRIYHGSSRPLTGESL